MHGPIKQSSSARPLLFRLVNEVDHVTPMVLVNTSTITRALSKNGGSFGTPHSGGTVTEVGNGWYALAGDTTDTNTLGELILHAVAPSCDPYAAVYLVVASDPTAAAVQVDLTQAVPTSNTAHTLGDALNGARAQAFGKWVKSGATLTLYASDGTTVVRTFTLDDATHPTSRV